MNKKEKEFEGETYYKKTEIELYGDDAEIFTKMTQVFTELDHLKGNFSFLNIGSIIEALRKYINILTDSEVLSNLFEEEIKRLEAIKLSLYGNILNLQRNKKVQLLDKHKTLKILQSKE